MNSTKLLLLALLAAPLLAGPALAEDAHHPATAGTAATADAAPSAPTAQDAPPPQATAPGAPMMGMMGQPMMMMPMMGMMPQGCPMASAGQSMMAMPMMGQPMMAMPMMGMMGSGGMGPGGMGPGGMGPGGMGPGGIGPTGMGPMDPAGMFDRIEGRIAFLRAELRISDEQANGFDAFAEALRSNAKRLGELRAAEDGMPAEASVAARFEWQGRWLGARAEGIQAIRAAYLELEKVLSAEQQKTAADLFSPRPGRMGSM